METEDPVCVLSLLFSNQSARQAVCYTPTPSLGKPRWNELEWLGVRERDGHAQPVKTDYN